MGKETLHYFSPKEKEVMEKYKSSRDKMILPIIKALNKLGFTPDIVSYIGLITLVGFIYFINTNLLWACIFLLLHNIIDAFDGPLARLNEKEGDSGAFTDMMCDHTGIIIVVITLIYANLVNPVLASIYIYLYTLMIIFVIIRNTMKIPIKFVFRSKMELYAVFIFFAIFGINFLNIALIIFIITTIPPVVSSYLIMKRKL